MAKKTTTKKRKARAAKDKVLAATLYCYTKKQNAKYVRGLAAKRNTSYSAIVDEIIENHRKTQAA